MPGGSSWRCWSCCSETKAAAEAKAAEEAQAAARRAQKEKEEKEFKSLVPNISSKDMSQDLRKAHQSLLAEEALRRTEQHRNATLTQQVAALGEERSALLRAKAKAEQDLPNFQAQLADSQRTQQELQHQLLETQRDSALHVRQLQEQLAASEQVQGALERELEDMRSRLQRREQERMQEQKVVPPLDLSSVGHSGYSGMTPRDVEQVQLAVAKSLHNEIAHTYLHMQQLLHEQQETPWHPASPRPALASSYSQDPVASEPNVPLPPPVASEPTVPLPPPLPPTASNDFSPQLLAENLPWRSFGTTESTASFPFALQSSSSALLGHFF